MKKLLIIPLLVALAITSSCSRHSSLTGMWTGTHHIDSSTDGPSSFNSRPSKTFCKITENKGQLSGSITEFGTDEPVFINTEKLYGTISNQVVEWKSSKSWKNAQMAFQRDTVFHGTLNGDTISGHFEQTYNYKDGKTVTYGGTVELKKQPNKSPEPTAVGAVSSAIAVHVASRRWLSFCRYHFTAST
jgi:hypothetical protein